MLPGTFRSKTREHFVLRIINPRFDNLVSRIHGEKKRYLSMWEGYVKKGLGTYNEKLAASLSEGYALMHTSGHCDMKSMRELFRLLQPKGIIPIHTDSPEVFAKLFSDEWSIIRLNDGKSIEHQSKFEHKYEDTPSV